MGILTAYGTASDGIRPSPIVYNDIPVEAIALGSRNGWGFFDHFVTGASHATTGITLPGWIVSEITDGTIQPGNEMGGSIILAPAAAENNGIQIQSGESFYPTAGYEIRFGARVKLLDADQMDIYVGLCTADTDVAQSLPNDCIGFNVADGSANILYKVSKDGTGDATDTEADASDATYVRLDAIVKGTSSVEFYVDGVLKITATSNIPNDEALAFAIANVAGENTANTLHVCHAYCWQWFK